MHRGFVPTIALLFLFTGLVPAEAEAPGPVTVAFLGDQGLSADSTAVLNMIGAQGADIVVHLGDFDYGDNPSAWDAHINATLGADFPYVAAIGNHDLVAWSGPAGYQQRLIDRLDRTPAVQCVGDLGVDSVCVFEGIEFILSGIGTLPNTASDPARLAYLQGALEASTSPWTICGWHKNQNAMQVGSKSNEVGWEAYELCRQHGAIIGTAHEHSYQRTRNLIDMDAQTVDPANDSYDDLVIEEGSTFVFVSGLGGRSIRDQDRCDPPTFPYGCQQEWASIYTSEQGAQSGALLCTFRDTSADHATCVFRSKTGAAIDTFTVTTAVDVEVGEVSIEEAATGAATGREKRATTGALTAVDGDLYLAAIAARPAKDVTSVTGMGMTWTPIASQCDAVGSTSAAVWYAVADGSAYSGGVTAQIAGKPQSISIAAVRATGAAVDPIGAILTTNAGGGPCSGGPHQSGYSVAAPATNGLLFGAMAGAGASHASASPAAEHAEIVAGSGSKASSIALVSQPGSAGSTVTGTFLPEAPWAGILVELVPGAPAIGSPPEAQDDAAATPVGQPVVIPVLANDDDPDGDPLVVVAVSTPDTGAASTDGSTVTYTPAPGFQGTDSFGYTISDGQGNTDTATITVTVGTPPAITLSADGYKVKGKHTVDLEWAGATGGTVTIHRDATSFVTSNDGAHTDAVGGKGGGSYTYRVCDDAECSADVVVTF